MARPLLAPIWWALIARFRSRAALEVEILVLQHQLNVLRRKSSKRLAFISIDRLCRLFLGKAFWSRSAVTVHRRRIEEQHLTRTVSAFSA